MGIMDQVGKAAEKAKPVLATEGTTETRSKGAVYQEKQKKQRYEAALKIEALIKRSNLTLTADEQAALTLLTKVPGEGNKGSLNFGEPVINRLFGANPQKGQSLTALEVFTKTGKGFETMKQLMRKWAEKGTIVELKGKDGDARYEITAIGKPVTKAEEDAK